MRVITRRSKLLYFRKHLPRGQFLNPPTRSSPLRPRGQSDWSTLTRSGDGRGRGGRSIDWSLGFWRDEEETPRAGGKGDGRGGRPGDSNRGRANGRPAERLGPRKHREWISQMTGRQHASQIIILMGCAAGLFGWMAGHTAVMFNDGLRYIDQARRIDAGSSQDGLLKAVDHPAYPAGIASWHIRSLLADDTPDDWQQVRSGGISSRRRSVVGRPALSCRGRELVRQCIGLARGQPRVRCAADRSYDG